MRAGRAWSVLLFAALVALSACVSSPTPEARGPSPSAALSRPSPSPTSTRAATSASPGISSPVASATPAPIPPGSAALFYPARLDTIQSRLPVQVQYTDPEGGGYVTIIRSETTSTAIVRDIPALERVDIVSTSISPSYAKKAVYPYTTNGRLFVATDWGSDWTSKEARWDLQEFDPATGKAVGGSTTFYASGFAVVGGKVYYRESTTTDLFGKVVSGGELKVQSLSGGLAKQLLAASHPDNGGTLFGVGDALLSVAYGGTAEKPTLTIRKHDLGTGAATVLHANVARTPNLYDDIFPGQGGLYHLTQSGRTVTVTRYPVEGAPRGLISVDLEGAETGIHLAEDKGKLLILALSNVRFTGAQVYDLATGAVSALKIAPFSQPVSYGRIGVAFLALG